MRGHRCKYKIFNVRIFYIKFILKIEILFWENYENISCSWENKSFFTFSKKLGFNFILLVIYYTNKIKFKPSFFLQIYFLSLTSPYLYSHTVLKEPSSRFLHNYDLGLSALNKPKLRYT